MVVYALLSWNDPHVVIHVRRSGELVKRLECRGPSNHLQKIPIKKKNRGHEARSFAAADGSLSLLYVEPRHGQKAYVKQRKVHHQERKKRVFDC
jgi:hypothetical protein